MTYLSLLHLSNHARDASACSDHAAAAEAIETIETRLRMPRRCIEEELHGRKAVDALLNLALAGADTKWLFTELCDHAEYEVRRWGRRKSCTSMTLAQLAERTAAAGCCGPLGLYDTLGDILTERDEPTYACLASALAHGNFSLTTSDPAARWVFRTSSRHGKEASTSASGFASGADWGAGVGADNLAAAFEDSSRPLTVDLGCGFGSVPRISRAARLARRTRRALEKLRSAPRRPCR